MPERVEDLDELIGAARLRRMEPAPDFMARMLADALAAQPKPVAAAVAVAVVPPRRGWFAGLAALFGGVGGLAGVGGAALAGILLGYVQPAPVTEFADAVLGVQMASVDLIPTTDSLLAGE